MNERVRREEGKKGEQGKKERSAKKRVKVGESESWLFTGRIVHSARETKRT